MKLRVFAASCLALGLFRPAAIGFQKDKTSKLRQELESGYKKWIVEDAAYIISRYFERKSQLWMASEPCAGRMTGE
jgi:hypothetical protein